jgi:hypothetical protein
MAEREGQVHASRGVEPLAAAEVGVTILDMQVGVAQAAALDADQHFLGHRFRCFDDGLAERRIEFDQRLPAHLCHEIQISRSYLL